MKNRRHLAILITSLFATVAIALTVPLSAHGMGASGRSGSFSKDVEIVRKSVVRGGNVVTAEGTEILREITGAVDFEAGPLLLLPGRSLVVTDTAGVAAYFAGVDANDSWVVRRIVAFGDGPNELRSIDYIHRTDDGFVVGGMNSHVRFSLSGAFMDKEPRALPFGEFALLGDSCVLHPTWIHSGAEVTPPRHLLELYTNTDDEWQLVSELMPYEALKRTPPDSEAFLAFMGSVALGGQRVWFVPRFENSLFTATLGAEGTLFYHFDDPRYERFEESSRDDWVLINHSIASLPDGSVLIGRGPQRDGAFSVDRFDADGTLLQEIHIDLSPMYISADEDRLLVADRWRENRIMLHEAPW